MRVSRFLLQTALITVTLALVFAAGFGAHWLLTRASGDSLTAALTSSQGSAAAKATGNFNVFWEAWNILGSSFYGVAPSDEQRTYGAIKGMVQEFQDPYTYFIEPQPRQREKEELSGEFGGIGAWVSKAEDGTIRLKPMPDGPAERAGVVENDILTAVDDTLIAAEATQDDVVTLVRGPIGQPVKLALLREGNDESLTVTVVRERIETPSVEWRILSEDPQTGYIAIRLFGERTAKELDRALDDLKDKGAQRLIVDLRHNTGGLLQASIDVTSRFLNDGVVVYERKQDGSETTYRVVNAPRAPNWPVAVLVDEATASASEIVAGALQDRGRATLIGEKTFGKGSVQMVHDLSDGSSIHVTVAHWMTPNGHEINGIGLTPDLPVPHEDGRDAPLEQAIAFLKASQIQ